MRYTLKQIHCRPWHSGWKAIGAAMRLAPAP
jgi:hypothetical protein